MRGIPVVDLTGADALAEASGVQIVSHVRIETRPPRAPREPRARTVPTGDSSADVVEVVGEVRGSRALVDLPHLRFQCGVHAFSDGEAALLHCANCFCFVCDVLASECATWHTHAAATDKDDASASQRRSLLSERAGDSSLVVAVDDAGALDDILQWQQHGS